METLDYNRLLLVSLWQYNHHGEDVYKRQRMTQHYARVMNSSLKEAMNNVKERLEW